MIGIVDYGMGNLLSVKNALEYMGEDAVLCTEPDMLEEAERIVLPGVGAFGDCIRNLTDRGFVAKLNSLVLQEKRPIMGICLGMQVMAALGTEGGENKGLGWFDAEVIRIDTYANEKLRVPNVGWCELEWQPESPLFKGLRKHSEFYFVHSYFVECKNPAEVDAWIDYGGRITAAIRKGNIFGAQFHPEKSQDYGMRLLENFLNWKPAN